MVQSLLVIEINPIFWPVLYGLFVFMKTIWLLSSFFGVNNDMVVGIHESTIESQMLEICEILSISMKNKKNGCLIILIFP